MKTVAQAMKSPVITVQPGDSAADLADLTRRHAVRHFPVVAGDRILGLVTDRNIREAVSSPRTYSLLLDLIASVDGVRVEEIMVRDVVVITPEASLRDAGRLMAERRIGCLPVVEDGKLVGILTQVDVLRALTAE